jgi:uncharacterized UPF0160 family protein
MHKNRKVDTSNMKNSNNNYETVTRYLDELPDSELTAKAEKQDTEDSKSTFKFDDADEFLRQTEEFVKSCLEPEEPDIPKIANPKDLENSNFCRKVNCSDCAFKNTCEITRVDDKLQFEDSCSIGLSHEQSESALYEMDKQNFEDINTRFKVKNSHIGMLDRYNKELRNENEQLKNSNESLQDRLYNIAVESTDLESRVIMLEDQNKELISEIDRLSNLDTRKALDEQIEARNRLATENLKLEQEVKRLSTLINEYVGSNDKLEQKIKDNEDVIKVLSEELDSKDEEFRKERNNNVKFFQKLCTYDNIIKKQKNQLEAYKGLIDEQLKTINTLTETNLALTTGLLNKESIEK